MILGVAGIGFMTRMLKPALLAAFELTSRPLGRLSFKVVSPTRRAGRPRGALKTGSRIALVQRASRTGEPLLDHSQFGSGLSLA